MLYQNIVDYFVDNIEKGLILPGEKLPSLRKISDKFDVSLSTAVEAYRKLELFGYAQVKDRSGYSARFPSSDNVVAPSKKFKSKVCEIQHIDEIIELMNHTMNKDIAPFGIGVPAIDRFPNKMINKYLSQTIKHHPESSSAYLFGLGYELLRKELVSWIKPWCGVNSFENVMITNGCLEALNIALSAECEAGDLVAIESPCYFGILHAIHHHGLKALELKTDPLTGIDPEAFEALAKTKNIKVLISTPTAQNPLGFTMTDERKKEILGICKKYKIKLIEDDLYGELCYEKKRPKTYKYFDKDDIVTYCSSFSKFLGPGLRIGWVIPSGDVQKYVRQKLSLNLASNSLTQYTVAKVLKNEDLIKIGHDLGNYYQNNVNIYSNILQKELGDKLRLTKPTGSYFLWARVEGLDSAAAYQAAKKNKISFTPGTLFSANRQYQNYLRINCAFQFNEKRHDELIRLAKILGN